MRRGRRAGPPAESVDGTLEEVEQLRLLLLADLSLAAAAAEQGEHQVLADIVTADRLELAAFVQRCVERLVEADQPERPVRSVRRPAALGAARLAPLGAAAAVVAVLVSGATGSATPDRHPARSQLQLVESSWRSFFQVASSDATAPEVVAAGERLHASLSRLVREAPRDPVKARKAVTVLEQERQVLLRDRPDGMSVVLAQAEALSRTLGTQVPPLPQVDPVAVPSAPAPSPSAPSATSATTSSAPSPSPSAPHVDSPSPSPPSVDSSASVPH